MDHYPTLRPWEMELFTPAEIDQLFKHANEISRRRG